MKYICHNYCPAVAPASETKDPCVLVTHMCTVQHIIWLQTDCWLFEGRVAVIQTLAAMEDPSSSWMDCWVGLLKPSRKPHAQLF